MDRPEDFFVAKAKLIWDNLPRTPSGRIRRGVLKQITEASGGVVDGHYLRQLAEGKFTNPRADKLTALAKALGFPVEWWWVPLEEGLPPKERHKGVTVGMHARLTRLPPARQFEAIQAILRILEEFERSQKPDEGSGE